MYTITTLHQLRQRLGLAASDTAEDDRLLAALTAASAQIERSANRRFTPASATLLHDAADPTILLLDDDLLALTALTNGDGNTIALSDVQTVPDTGGDSPFSVLRLKNNAAFVWHESPELAISVTGIWGWHDRWSRAWRDSADTVGDNPLSAAATTINVTDADGVDTAQQSPRFQVGHLLRIASEYLRVLAVDTTTNQLTVLRGVNGTTAASHAQSTKIETFQPAQEAQMLALRWAAWLYKEPDTGKAQAIPADLLRAAKALRRVHVGA